MLSEFILQTQPYTGHWWWNGYYPVFVFGWLIFLAIVFSIWFIFIRFRGKNWLGCYSWAANSSEGQAILILRNRLARGEITTEEYEELKRRIG